MALDPTMQAGLEQPAFTMFTAVEAVLPAATVGLLDGAGFVTFSSKSFQGRNPTYGVLAGVEALTDGVGDEAPSLRITVHPPTNTAAAAWAAADAQGSDVNVWVGVVNVQTGAVVGAPELVFSGEIDVPTLEVDKGLRQVVIECSSIFERFFEGDEGLEMTNASHQSIWPGETGFDMVTETTRQLPWGQDAPRPGAISTPVGANGGFYDQIVAAAARVSGQKMGLL